MLRSKAEHSSVHSADIEGVRLPCLPGGEPSQSTVKVLGQPLYIPVPPPTKNERFLGFKQNNFELVDAQRDDSRPKAKRRHTEAIYTKTIMDA